jgi:hypothetical protein
MSRSTYLRLAGWALVVNAVIGFILFLDWAFDLSQPDALVVLHLLGLLLFIAGLPALQLVEPRLGRNGQIGIGLTQLGAAIAFVVILLNLVSSVEAASAVTFTSSLAGMLGYVMLGVLFVRGRYFRIWVGAFLVVAGIINFVTGQVSSASGWDVVIGVGWLMEVLAIAQLGWSIAQEARVLDAEPRTV